MLIEANVVNDEGTIIECYMVRKEDAIHDNWITEPIPEGLFEPTWNFQQKKWVEGLKPEIVELKKREINEFNKRISDEELNAIAIMELTQIVLGR